MSIRRTLDRPAREDVELFQLSPDKLLITPPELVELCEDYVRWDETFEINYIPLHLAWKVKDQLMSWKNPPEWLEPALGESRWAYDNFWDVHNGIAWLFDNRLVVQTGFTLTLSERIMTLNSTMTTDSMDLRAWVVVEPDLEDGSVVDIMQEYQITPSPLLQARIEGRERWKEALRSHVQKAEDGDLVVPSMFRSSRQLKEHQQEGALGLAGLGSGLLADQVGLGKGGEFVSGYLARVERYLKAHGDAEASPYPIVLVTNKSLREELAEEVLKWHEDAHVVVLRSTQSSPIDPDAQFIVLNIDLMKSRVDDLIEAVPRAMVVDEAHTLQNEDSLRSQATFRLAQAVRELNGAGAYVVLATGTPFLNRPIQLWSILNILGAADLFAAEAMKHIGPKVRVRTTTGWKWVKVSPKRAFEIRWCDGTYDRYGNWYNGGASNTAELNRLLLEHVMIRRRKSDVMHPLPELGENLIPMQMNDEDRAEYTRIEEEFVDWMKEQAALAAETEGISIAEAVRLVYRKLKNAEGMMRRSALRRAVARGKLGPTREWIHRFMAGDPAITGGDPDRNKLIVFAYHRDIQAELIAEPEFQQYGMVSITAGQDGADVQLAKRMFQKDPRCRLIICYSGAREGHTLTAARDVLLVEIPDSPVWVVQMAGRCWARISEDFEPHEATIHYAVVPGTVDSLLLSRVRFKKAIFNAIIDGEGIEELAEDSTPEEQLDTLMELMSRGHRVIGIAS